MRPSDSEADDCVEAAVMRVLAEVPAALGHRPDVHRAITIAEEIDAAVPEHRVLAGALVVGGQRDGFLVAVGIPPDVLRRAALVPLGVAALKGKPREVQRLAGRIVTIRRSLARAARPIARRSRD